MDTKRTTTPKGELEWVIITGEGKENMSGKLQYVASIVLDPENDETAAAYITEIKDFWDEFKPKGFKKAPKSMGYYEHTTKTDETDEEGKAIYEPTGKTLLQFKTGTTYADGKPKVIKIFNAKAKEVFLGTKSIGNGTIGHIGGVMGVYKTMTPNGKTIVDAGVTLFLDRIQIKKFVEYEQASGFDSSDEDDGIDDGLGGMESEPEETEEAKVRL